MKLGSTELILLLVLALIIFGGGKLSGVGKAIGKSIKEFKAEVKTDDKTTHPINEDKEDDTNYDKA